jgi:hypothetical protein
MDRFLSACGSALFVTPTHNVTHASRIGTGHSILTRNANVDIRMQKAYGPQVLAAALLGVVAISRDNNQVAVYRGQFDSMKLSIGNRRPGGLPTVH